MMTIFRYTLTRYRGQIIGWGLALFLLSLMVMVRYDVIMENQAQIREIVKGSMGQLMRLFVDPDKLFNPEGFLNMQLFTYLPLILGIFAVLAGSGLLATDEENGTLDLVLAHPVSRTAFFLGRLLALVAATVALLVLSWLGLLFAKNWSSLAVDAGELVLPYLSLLAVLLVFATLALALSMVLPARRTAGMAAGMVLMACFFLTLLRRLDETLETYARLSPLNYYQGGDALRGLNVGWFAGLLTAAGLFTALAWWRFERRDIRVSGEGAWRWPFRRRAAA
jgi:ABC-2 type transport system permease protein